MPRSPTGTPSAGSTASCRTSPLVGLANYQAVFATPRFWTNDVFASIVFTLVFVGGCIVMGLLLAILIDQHIRAESLFRSIFLFPMALSFVVTGTVWAWILNPTNGINVLLDATGLSAIRSALLGVGVLQPLWGLLDSLRVDMLRPGMTADPRAVLAAVGLAAIWQMSGFVMALYLAGLRGVSDELREAGRMDGASEISIYRRIVIPLLRPDHGQRHRPAGLRLAQDVRPGLRAHAWWPRPVQRPAIDLHVRDHLQEQPVGARRGGGGADAAGLGRRGGAVHPVRAAAAQRMTATTLPTAPTARPPVRRRPRVTRRRVALYALLIGLAILYLIPVYVVLVGSMKTGTEIEHHEHLGTAGLGRLRPPGKPP